MGMFNRLMNNKSGNLKDLAVIAGGAGSAYAASKFTDDNLEILNAGVIGASATTVGRYALAGTLNKKLNSLHPIVKDITNGSAKKTAMLFGGGVAGFAGLGLLQGWGNTLIDENMSAIGGGIESLSIASAMVATAAVTGRRGVKNSKGKGRGGFGVKATTAAFALGTGYGVSEAILDEDIGLYQGTMRGMAYGAVASKVGALAVERVGRSHINKAVRSSHRDEIDWLKANGMRWK